MKNNCDILIKTLIEGGKELGFVFSDLQLQQFKQYYEFLIETNAHINLTNITEPQEVALKHFLDSLICFKAFDFKGSKKVIDVGSGAGFPGMVLKIFNNDLDLVLLDSLQKRVDFLNKLIAKLKLPNIKAIHGRAEEVGKNNEHREKYDIVISRAVANLSVLAEYCLPLAGISGSFIAMKGPNVEDEIKAAHKAITLLGGEVTAIKEFSLPIINDQRTILIINKVTPTPNKYPRRAGMPAKKPL